VTKLKKSMPATRPITRISLLLSKRAIEGIRNRDNLEIITICNPKEISGEREPVLRIYNRPKEKTTKSLAHGIEYLSASKQAHVEHKRVKARTI
jgi:hypothetical protein